MLNDILALVPIVIFLVDLQLMDSFKLVRPGAVVLAMCAGGLAALACVPLHDWLLTTAAIDRTAFSRYFAPLTEEALKASFLIVLIARRRVGFPVDAAVHGFAVGTGFALVENVIYLRALPHAPLLLWLVRGLGTAVLHGATMSIFAMISRTLADKYPERLWLVFWPGWIAAVVIHSAFNHVLVSPVAMTLALLVVLPALVLVVFRRSEQATREWVSTGLDLDVELLQLVRSDAFAYTRFGLYLQRLRTKFPGPIVADMFCLLRLELELSVQARARVLAQEAGLTMPVDGDLSACLAEIEYLHASIGTTGMLALKPLMVSSHRDRWHQYLLAQADPQSRALARARAGRLRWFSR